jgi:hypothetical protein
LSHNQPRKRRDPAPSAQADSEPGFLSRGTPVFVRSWLEAIHEYPSAVAIRESLNYPYLLTFHTITILLFAGLILMMDLRLVGIAFRTTPLSQIQKKLFPWQMVMMVLNSISGVVLFYAQPMRYYPKPFFWIKMGLIVFAGVNALAFHFGTYRSVADWDTSTEVPAGAKLAGAFSIVLWAGVIFFGRVTAYNWADLKLAPLSALLGH